MIIRSITEKECLKGFIRCMYRLELIKTSYYWSCTRIVETGEIMTLYSIRDDV